MLSPHEVATLLLIHSAPDQIDPACVEVDTLLQRDLVRLSFSARGHRCAELTEQGQSMLNTLIRE